MTEQSWVMTYSSYLFVAGRNLISFGIAKFSSSLLANSSKEVIKRSVTPEF